MLNVNGFGKDYPCVFPHKNQEGKKVIWHKEKENEQ